MVPGTSIGSFELMVMLALMRLGDDAYGVAIGREIATRGGREAPLPSIYAALARLESKGLVRSSLGEPTAERGGRAKRYFRVTASGVREVRATRQVLSAMWNGLPHLKGSTA